MIHAASPIWWRVFQKAICSVPVDELVAGNPPGKHTLIQGDAKRVKNGPNESSDRGGDAPNTLHCRAEGGGRSRFRFRTPRRPAGCMVAGKQLHITFLTIVPEEALVDPVDYLTDVMIHGTAEDLETLETSRDRRNSAKSLKMLTRRHWTSAHGPGGTRNADVCRSIPSRSAPTPQNPAHSGDVHFNHPLPASASNLLFSKRFRTHTFPVDFNFISHAKDWG